MDRWKCRLQYPRFPHNFWSIIPDHPELFGYLSTELLLDDDTDLRESSEEDRAADHVRNMLTIPVITVPTLNPSERVSRKGPLIQELPQSDDSPQVENDHSVSISIQNTCSSNSGSSISSGSSSSSGGSGSGSDSDVLENPMV